MEGTLAGLFADSVRTFGPKDFLKWKEGGVWRAASYSDVGRDVDDLARGLIASGVDAGDRVAIFSPNSHTWVMTDLAIVTSGAVTVPIYATSTADTVRYVLDHSGAKMVLVAEGACSSTLQKALDTFSWPGKIVPLRSFSDLRGLGANEPHGVLAQRRAALRPEDMSTILYTSGTTGNPKGVMLTHDNILFDCDASLAYFPVTSADSTLSFLPFSHAFERTGGLYIMMKKGVTIHIAEDVNSVPKNLVEVQPSILLSVPRLLEKFHGRVHEKMDSKPGILRALFRVAVSHAAKCLKNGKKDFLYRGFDLLFFRKLRAALGGRLRFIVSGGAALSPHIAEFFTSIGIPVIQGYGLTETSPVATLNPLDRNRIGTVGLPLPGVEIKIAQDGEILIRGRNIMKGYLRDEDATKAVLKEDGWFYTGDIGELDEKGYLRITDRKKELIKTSGGKYIAPQPMENELKLSPLVDQACVLGEGQKFASVLIVPNYLVLEARAKERGITWATKGDLSLNPTIRGWYEELVKGFNASRASYETLKKFDLIPDEWTVESGEITPTMKLRRKVIHQKYAATIQKLYG